MTTLPLYFVYNSITVLTAALFGMFAVWAFRSRWHWFARAMVVAGALTLLWYVSEYVVVAGFAVGTALFLIGLSVWSAWCAWRGKGLRGKPAFDRWPQLSLRDIFLLVSVAAAVLAIAVNAPAVNTISWLYCLLPAPAFALLGLACTWCIFGTPSWQIRALASPLLLALGIVNVGVSLRLTSVLRFSSWQEVVDQLFAENTWTGVARSITQPWQPFLDEWAPAIVVGVAAFCTWLWAAKNCGWIEWHLIKWKPLLRRVFGRCGVVR